MEEEIKQDSYTIGSSVKEGAIKVYFNLQKMSDEKAKELVERANGLFKYIQGLGK